MYIVTPKNSILSPFLTNFLKNFINSGFFRINFGCLRKISSKIMILPRFLIGVTIYGSAYIVKRRDYILLKNKEEPVQRRAGILDLL